MFFMRDERHGVLVRHQCCVVCSTESIYDTALGTADAPSVPRGL
jgi:hypothetical protein